MYDVMEVTMYPVFVTTTNKAGFTELLLHNLYAGQENHHILFQNMQEKVKAQWDYHEKILVSTKAFASFF